MSCITCKSEKIARISSKTSDLNVIYVPGKKEYEGYIPKDLGIGGGDYLRFQYCLNCGQIQGKFPLEITSLEDENIEDSETN